MQSAPVVFYAEDGKDTPEISVWNAGLQTVEVSVRSYPSDLHKHSGEQEET